MMKHKRKKSAVPGEVDESAQAEEVDEEIEDATTGLDPSALAALGATFLCKARNMTLVMKPETETYFHGQGFRRNNDGRGIEFTEGVATVKDWDMISWAVKHPMFGREFFINPADPTGFWKTAIDVFGRRTLEKGMRQKLEPIGMEFDMAMQNALAMSEMQQSGVEKMQDKSISPADVVPVYSSGRSVLSEAQIADLRAKGVSV